MVQNVLQNKNPCSQYLKAGIFLFILNKLELAAVVG